MNLNFNECQIKKAFKKHIQHEIVVKPFIALNDADFIFGQNYAYIGRFYGAGEFTVTNRINDEVRNSHVTDNVVFTEMDAITDYNYFKGYQIIADGFLYAPKSYAFKFSSVYDACTDPHPTAFKDIILYSATNDAPNIADTGRAWFIDADLQLLPNTGAYAHSSLADEVINLDLAGVQTALVCK